MPYASMSVNTVVCEQQFSWSNHMANVKAMNEPSFLNITLTSSLNAEIFYALCKKTFSYVASMLISLLHLRPPPLTWRFSMLWQSSLFVHNSDHLP